MAIADEKAKAATQQLASLSERLEKADARSADLTQELDRSQANVSSLAEQLDGVKEIKDTLVEREQQLNTLTEQLADAHARIKLTDHESELRAARLTEQVAMLSEQSDKLKCQVESAQSEAEQVQNQNSEYRQQIQTLRKDWQTEKSTLNQELEIRADKLAQQARRSADAESKLEQVKATLTADRAAFEERFEQQKLIEAAEFQSQLRSAQSSLTSTRIELEHFRDFQVQQSEKLDEARRTVEQLNDQLSQSKKIAADQADVIEGLRSQLERERHTHKLEIDELKRLVQVAEDSSQSLRGRLEATSTTRDIEDTSSQIADQLRDELHKQNMRLIELETTNQELVARLKESEKRSASMPAVKRSTKKFRTKKTGEDDLTVITGIGPVAARKLHDLGVTTVKQIANWSQADIERYRSQLSVGGRIERERWVEQAKEFLN